MVSDNHFRPVQTVLAILCLALATGCATNARPVDREALRERVPQLNRDLFGDPAPVADFEDMVALTPEQKQDFLEFYKAGKNQRFRPHRRIYKYLIRRLSDTDFRNQTLPASTTIETRIGNCMSLALVTTAFARLTDIDIGWQLAKTDPMYSSDSEVIYSANHIQTRLYKYPLQDKPSSFTIGQPYLVIDYFTDRLPEAGTELSEREMIALVYQNLGVEALADGDLAKSFWRLKKGLEYDAANANLYNTLAVLHRRAGDNDTAETLYRFALDEFGDRLIVLRNYRKLLLAAGRHDEAEQLRDRVMRLPDPDPYPILTMGDKAAEQGNNATALSYYKKAADVAPYLHEIYVRIARIYQRQGDLKRAERALRKARKKAWTDDGRQRYQAKLSMLQEAG